MIEREIIGLIGVLIFVILLIFRLPVGLAMILVGIGGNFALSVAEPFLRFEPYLKQFKSLLWNNVANYDLSVVPLFILMGFLASQAGLSRNLFQGFQALLGRFRGGVAIAAIGSCAGFGAICGSSLATASTMGRIALPELQRLNYAPRLATGTLAAGGTLGILIPPSVALVIYAIIVEASIIDMFRAAIIPGLMAVIFFISVIVFQVRRKPELAPPATAMARDERRKAIMRLIPVLVVFGVIILGLGIGLFTPTPAAAVGVMLILGYGIVLRRYSPDKGLSLPGFKSALLDTAVTSGMIYFILFGAEVLKGFFSRSGLPTTMATWSSASNMEPWALLVLILMLLIIMGCFMDTLAMLSVVVAFLWPTLIGLNGGDYVTAHASAFGMTTDDLKIWFGIIALVVIELGLITPPVGLNVFIIASIAKNISMTDIFKGVLPFFLIEIIRVAVLLTFPALCLLLPNYLS